MLRDTLWLARADHHLMSLRYKRAPGFGVHGGGDGPTGGIWLTDEGGEETTWPAWRTASTGTRTGCRSGRRGGRALRYITAGGGGWGDPFEREPERVLRDVRDGYVTIDGAARDYGVVVTGDPRGSRGLRRRRAATERLRSAR